MGNREQASSPPAAQAQPAAPPPAAAETPPPAQASQPAAPPAPPPVIEAPASPPPAPPEAARKRPVPPVASYKVPTTIPKGGVPYRIRWGDTLWDISEAFYRNPWLYPRIARFNNIRNPDRIISGRTIRIPPRN
ncbi:MAG: LysM peptidoglycan-binding domain-containing protein [Treponema sp.]|nr:LysM peptidoglycan-binding domain-containing protein [Treponema sp.]